MLNVEEEKWPITYRETPIQLIIDFFTSHYRGQKREGITLLKC